MKIIALDVGEKRIGVARADSATRIAVPVGYIAADGLEWQEIAKIARLNNTNFFVLGLPRSNEGKETAQSMYVRQFAKRLSEKIPGIRVRFQDESLTSVIAEERLRARKKRYERGEIDAEAASIILQDFLEGLRAEQAFNDTLTDVRPKPSDGSRVARVATGVKTAVSEAKDSATNITKKEADKVKLNAKKAKHKMKTATKWITGIVIIAVLGGILC